MPDATMTDARPAYTLLAEPEAFQELETGRIHETFVFDGQHIAFACGGEAVTFHEFTVHLFKADADTLTALCLDVVDLPVPVFRQVGAVTGLPTDGEMDEAASVMVRFEMRPEPLAQVQAAMLTCQAFGEWLDTTDAEGVPLFWNLGNYFTQSLMGG